MSPERVGMFDFVYEPPTTGVAVGQVMTLTGPSGRAHGVEITDVKHLFSRGVEPKSLITGYLTRDTYKKKPLSLLVKMPVLGPLQTRISAVRYWYRWLTLVHEGIPTIPTLYLISHELVGMKNVESDGSRLYSENMANALAFSYEDLKLVDDIFLHIDPRTLLSEAQQVIEAATDRSLVLEEPPHVLVHPDGTHDVLIWDLGGTHRLGETSLHLSGNSDILNIFADDMDRVRYHVEAQRDLQQTVIAMGW